MATNAQRTWRANCPNCGAPVDFASAASASAVCSFCRSTLVRDGEALKRIGVSAELFDDHSPLQLGAAGRYMGAAFTVVGRQQLSYDGGTWNEWHVLFDGQGGQRSGWLSEDNGAYVMAFDAPFTGPVPSPNDLHPGHQFLLAGSTWSVGSVVGAKVLAAQGELPQPPRTDGGVFAIADFRNVAEEVATLDWRNPSQVAWSVGRSVRLAELQMTGLREQAEKALGGRAIPCPNCGAALEPTLSTTQSIVCGQCKSVVDVSQGVGGEMAHYAQENAGAPPQIPLGRTGTLQLGAKSKPLPWQVVGYVERVEIADDPDEEQVAWREYLLYHREEGFNFLVDSEDGWSFARPLTGVPKVRGDQAEWQGSTYKKLYSYTGAVTYVLGEFYWRLSRGERTHNIDFAAGDKRLNREQAGNEVTWSAGEALEAEAVAKAFGLDDGTAKAMRRDVSPVGDVSLGKRLVTYLVIGLVVLTLIALMSRCSSSDDCDSTRATFGEASAEYQQCLRNRSSGSTSSRGGSYGGFSSGGGGSHK